MINKAREKNKENMCNLLAKRTYARRTHLCAFGLSSGRCRIDGVACVAVDGLSCPVCHGKGAAEGRSSGLGGGEEDDEDDGHGSDEGKDGFHFALVILLFCLSCEIRLSR